MSEYERKSFEKRDNYGNANRKRKKFDTKKKFGQRLRPKDVENGEIKRLQSLYAEIGSTDIEKFDDFPLSQKTQDGLYSAGYTTPTEIQRESIGLALQGHDILGAAKTGSGKTLAFIVPVLECLFRLKWSSMDGLGALIITPTRELAYQIFEVLRKIGKHHDFSAGLVIGGKHLREESERIPRTNVVICTPGRLLQHMDETVFFKADSLQILVLDEADRILDLGFQQSMNAIIDNLPLERQTLLFSATQTRSVKDLARLSLKEPMYVSVHEHSQHSTPAQLEQSYMVCELHDKLNLLWSFIKNHLKQKVLVFMQSCKQVRFVYEVIKRLRPGTTLLALYGAMPQLKRVGAYQQFCRKQNAVLIATDIAARGLDFPAVHWVLQLDCPEDSNTYIHRAGRTARYEKNGEALLVLLPSEKDDMLAQLQEKKIPINNIKVNPKKLWSIQGKVDSLLAADVPLKDFAKGAFVSYVKSVHLMSNKKVFDVKKLDTDKYAHSLGLAIPPRIRFLQKEEKRRQKQEEQAKKDAEVDEIFARVAAIERKQELKESRAEKAAAQQERKAKLLAGLEQKSKPESGSEESEEEQEDSEEESEEEQEDSEEESEEESESESNDKESGNESENGSESVGGEVELQSDGGEARLAFDVGDEDLDDILTMKSKSAISPADSSGEEEEEEEEEEDLVTKVSNKAKKKAESAVTKYKVAKLLTKKNIKVNKKVVFDELGEAVVDKLKPTVMSSDDDEDDGGINIEEAKQRMQKEDRVDREIFRERVKKMHREKRLKAKDERRRQHQGESDEEEVVATLGGADDDADEDDGALPEAMGNGSEEEESEEDQDASEDENSEGNEDSESSEDEDEPPRKKSRARRRAYEGEIEDEPQLGTEMDLADEEELALKLLS